MKRRTSLRWMSLLLAATALIWSSGPAFSGTMEDTIAVAAKKVKPSDLKAAAARQAAAIARASKTGTADVGPRGPAPDIASIGPGNTPDYFSTPNWANSPPLRKFVDPLPMLWDPRGGGVAPAKCIPLAVPDTTTYPGSDYYEIELHQYQEKMHSDLLPTTLRGYVQVNKGTNALCGGAGQPACTTANNTVVPAPIRYLGPLIVAQKDRPVRVKFTNKLPTGDGGKLFLPVDTTIMGSGEFEIDYDLATLLEVAPKTGTFTQNRATLHLHGGRTPWISDGTPHQWITPDGETTDYPKGISAQNVPDMPDPGAGSETFYWTNQQSARLMFYHDHAWGITRLNVYAGEAAGYLIQDQAEKDLLAAGLLPADQIPLVIQDKTFVDPATIKATDPTWAWGSQPWDGTPGAAMTPVQGDLWWPHVYMPAQNPFNSDMSGINAMGRWHYGPWFFPATPLCFSDGGTDPQAVPPYCVTHVTAPNPYYDPACDPDVAGFCQPPEIPGTPDVSWGAEAFLDTMLVNGTAYPTLTVSPKAYRFRILNAAHDRFLNLQLYKTSPIVGGITVTNPGSGYTTTTSVTITGGGGKGATAEAVLDLDPLSPTYGKIMGIDLTSVGSGYTWAPMVTIKGSGTGATAKATIYTAKTEVGMVPAAKTAGFPTTWPADGREGGVPDPATAGPAWIQVGTEGGFLPAPVLLKNQPVAWNLDPTMFNVGNVLNQADGGGTLFVGPAERADVIVDFSKYAGKTLILYNDAPTAFPALDPHYDYYTGAPDRTDMGGAPSVRPGYGPNIRTVMKIVVTGSGGAAPANAYNATTLANLQNAFKSTGTPGAPDYTPGVFSASQEPIVVGQKAYNSTYSTTFPATWPNWGLSRISDTNISFETVNADRTIGAPQTLDMERKAIHDEMGGTFDDYGRMSAKLGLQVAFSNAAISTFALQNYVDPPTEILPENGVQIWRINHNGVDTHPIHFHLFDVQLINRVGWDGFIRLPDTNELGWKDTVRMSPLEDTIVALRPITPTQPFGLPESIRPLNPSAPLFKVPASEMGFSQIDPLTGAALAIPQTNEVLNFGWEYVWHCHILSHEENDMMRSISFEFVSTLPDVPGLSVTQQAGPQINLAWTDGTPVGPDPAHPLNLGDHANEIGFLIERADVVGGVTGAYAQIGAAVANAPGFADTDAALAIGNTYSYRVRAYNAAGMTAWSNEASLTTVVLNFAPSFTKGADQTVLLNSGPQTVAGWATAISAGPPSESAQTVDFIVTNDNNALFSAQPAIAPGGTLTYTSAPNAVGVATVTVQVHDSGGTAGGGVDTSAPQTFTITIRQLGQIEVTAPSTGVTLTQGSTCPVTWIGTTVNTGTYVSIRLYQGGTLVSTATSSTPNDGAFDWSVPASLAPGSYTLRVVWNANAAVYGTSAAFTVVSPTVTVSQPDGLLAVSRGTVAPVRWSGIPLPGSNVAIRLFQGGTLVATVANPTPNDGAFDWTVPTWLAPGSYELRVIWNSNTAVVGSSAAFTIN